MKIGLRTWSWVGTVFLAATAVPAVASAAPAAGADQADTVERYPVKDLGEDAYLEASPAGFATPFAGELDDAYQTSYQWDIAAGYLFRPTERLFIGLGGEFEHTRWNETAEGFDAVMPMDAPDVNAHAFRTGPELRLGTGNDRFMVYVGGAAGLDVQYINARGGNDDEVDPGAYAGARLGVQGMLIQGLYAGVEGFTNSSFSYTDETDELDDYTIHSGGARAFAGWYF